MLFYIRYMRDTADLNLKPHGIKSHIYAMSESKQVTNNTDNNEQLSLNIARSHTMNEWMLVQWIKVRSKTDWEPA